MAQQKDLFNRFSEPLVAGETLRDKGIEQVLDNAGEDWRISAERLVRSMRGQEATGEDIREACIKAGISPHHSNSWGGLVAGLVKRGLIQATGRYTAMRDPKSHARETKVYRIM